MRCRYDIPHDRIRYYPDALREAGYLSLNPGKTDYNLGGRDDKEPWDKGKIDFARLKQQQPFFAVVNLNDSHESRAHGSVEGTQHDPDKVTLAPYHPDLPDIRKNYAKYQDAVKRMDTKLGALLDELGRMGLDDNTIVIYNSDHGGGVASKQAISRRHGHPLPADPTDSRTPQAALSGQQAGRHGQPACQLYRHAQDLAGAGRCHDSRRNAGPDFSWPTSGSIARISFRFSRPNGRAV